MHADTLRLTAGVVVEGRFRLDVPVGEGTMGVVWAATEVSTRQRSALKFLRSTPDEELRRRRFECEVQAHRQVRHPHVVPIREALELGDGTPMMRFELLRGETLARRLERTGAQTIDEVAEWMAPLLRVLSAVHAAGVVHRDLKPANIYLTRGDPPEQGVRLLDLGIAKRLSRLGTEAFVETAGSPSYMAPEQFFGEPALDHRADVFSLGVIAFEALAGVRPVPGDTTHAILAPLLTRPPPALPLTVPREVRAMVRRMLAVDPEDRPGCLDEIARVFARGGAARLPDRSVATLTSRSSSRRSRG